MDQAEVETVSLVVVVTKEEEIVEVEGGIVIEDKVDRVVDSHMEEAKEGTIKGEIMDAHLMF